MELCAAATTVCASLLCCRVTVSAHHSASRCAGACRRGGGLAFDEEEAGFVGSGDDFESRCGGKWEGGEVGGAVLQQLHAAGVWLQDETLCASVMGGQRRKETRK
jgi:hypothetical protein